MKQDSAQSEDSKPPGSQLLVKITPHLSNIAEKSAPVRKEFYPSEEENIPSDKTVSDPLCEDQFIKAKGLVHKYPRRVLIELTMNCAAYCRFCTRRRMVSDIEKGMITQKEVDQMFTYLKNNPQINEVIFSGGDPLTVENIFIYAVNKIKTLPQIKIIRVHSRILVSDPKLLTPAILKTFRSIKNQTLYVSTHFEHPDEITPIAIKCIKKLRQAGAILLNQNVFLKGVNDSYEVLYELFNRLIELGVRPYVLYHCDPVNGAAHFIVKLEDEVKIMTKLRKNLSGIAFPIHAIDTPGGAGKIPVPQDFWEFNKEKFKDFDDKQIEVID